MVDEEIRKVVGLTVLIVEVVRVDVLLGFGVEED